MENKVIPIVQPQSQATTSTLPYGVPFDPITPRAGKIHEKIRAVCDAAANMAKESSGPGYRFTSYDAAMVSLRPVLSQQRLRLKFSERERTVDTQAKSRKGEAMTAALSVMWLYVIDIDTGEFDVTEASNYSSDANDKALAQANTGARKYALFDMFEIATNGAPNPQTGRVDPPANDDGDAAQGDRGNDRQRAAQNPPAAPPVLAPAPLLIGIRRTIERLKEAGQDVTEEKVLAKHAQGKATLEATTFVQAQNIANALNKYEKTLPKNVTPTA